MNLLMLPYVALGLGIISFGVWWLAYQNQARDPRGVPPNMWVVTAVHLFFVGLGFLAPFFLNPITQQLVFAITVGLAAFVLLVAMIAGFTRMRAK